MNLAWDDALWAAAALSVDPAGLRGVWLRCPHGPVRDAWLATLNELHPQARRLPNHADAERLLGGLDLSATLQTGKAVQQAGLLQQTSPTVLLLPMAERLPDDTAAILGQVLDQGMVGAAPTFIGLAALDEALDDEPPLAGGLQERLGIWLDLRQLGRAVGADEETQMMLAALPLQDMQAMRQHVQQVQANDAQMQALCQTAMALGVDSLRAPVAALRLACVLSGLRGFDSVQDEDLGRAARLVITPRATRVPPPPEQPEQEPAPPEPQEPEPPPEQDPADNPPEPPEPPQDEDITPQQMADVLLEAALATLPVDVLRQLAEGSKPLAAGRGQGRSGGGHRFRACAGE